MIKMFSFSEFNQPMTEADQAYVRPNWQLPAVDPREHFERYFNQAYAKLPDEEKQKALNREFFSAPEPSEELNKDINYEYDEDEDVVFYDCDEDIITGIQRVPRTLAVKCLRAQSRTDYKSPPLPVGYKKTNHGCDWTRELRPNDKYEFGPKYGVKILSRVTLDPKAAEKAARIWRCVGVGTFDPQLMAQGFRAVGKLLYDHNWYRKLPTNQTERAALLSMGARKIICFKWQSVAEIGFFQPKRSAM